MASSTLSLPASAAPASPAVLLVSLQRQWNKYAAALAGARGELAPAAVRALRVSARRLRQLLKLMGSLYSQPSLAISLSALKDQLERLDGLRDTQVMLQEIPEMLPQIPSMLEFQEYLQERESRLARKNMKSLKDFDAGWLLRPITGWIRSLDPALARQFTACILAEMDKSFQLARQRFDSLDPAQPASIHSFRIAFRKFRYLADALQGVVTGFPPKTSGRLQYYQGLLGSVQDFHNLIRSLAEFAAENPAFNPRPALDALNQYMADAVCVFTDQMSLLDTFWRSNPANPFPWEETR